MDSVVLRSLDVFLISLISIILFILLDKHVFKKRKQKRYFYFFVEDENYEVSSYVKGTETLNRVIEEFTNTYGYGIDFTVQEITKEKYESAKDKK